MDQRAPWLTAITAIAMVALGVAAMVLAVIEADHEALSVMFGFAGIATAVFGLLSPRLEGDFELSATRFKGKLLRQVRNVAVREDLTLEEKGDVLSALLLDRSPQGAHEPRQAEREAAGMLEGTADTLGWSSELPSVRIPPFRWPWPVPGKVSLRHIPREFESHVRLAFEAGGWTVSRLPKSAVGDFLVDTGEETLIVEAKAVRHLSLADIAQMVSRQSDSSESALMLVLVVPAETLSSGAARLIEETPMLAVVYVPIIEEMPGT